MRHHYYTVIIILRRQLLCQKRGGDVYHKPPRCCCQLYLDFRKLIFSLKTYEPSGFLRRPWLIQNIQDWQIIYTVQNCSFTACSRIHETTGTQCYNTRSVVKDKQITCHWTFISDMVCCQVVQSDNFFFQTFFFEEHDRKQEHKIECNSKTHDYLSLKSLLMAINTYSYVKYSYYYYKLQLNTVMGLLVCLAGHVVPVVSVCGEIANIPLFEGPKKCSFKGLNGPSPYFSNKKRIEKVQGQGVEMEFGLNLDF